MDIKVFEQKIEAAQARLDSWLQKIEQTDTASDLLLETTEEMTVGLEELQVAIEELYQQQEDLQAVNLEVQKERQRYLELFEYAPDGYLITDRWGVIQEVNRSAGEMLHRRPVHLAGKPLSIFIPPTERRSFYNLLQRLRQAEPITGVELAIQPSDNRPLLTAAISIAPVGDEQNHLVGFRWLLRDVTQLRQAQAESQKQLKRSRLLAEITLKIRQAWELETILQTAVTESQQLLQTQNVLIFRLESDKTATVLAQAGATKSCLSGQKVICNFLPTQDTPGRANNFAGVSQIIPPYSSLSAVDPNQSSETSSQSAPVNLVTTIYVRQQLWGFLAFHDCQSDRQWSDFEIDVSQQLADQIGIAVTQAQFIRNMEELVKARTEELRASNQQLQQEIEERLQIEESLRHSQEQLHLIADSLPVLISYIGRDRCYRFNNRVYEDWFGKPLTEICGHHVREVLGKEVYHKIEDQIEAVLSGREISFELQLPYQDRNLRWVKVNYIPHREDREVLGFFTLIEDISEHKAIEQIKDEFISIVSHELRTPLTSIHGSLRLLNAGRFGSLGEPGQQLIGLAERNTDRLVRLVNDILDLQRMDSGKTTIEKQPCNAADLVTTAAETMEELARQQDIILEYTPVSIPLVADPDHILQTLTNLLSNAIKFSPAQSKVKIKTAERHDDILFQVSDRGRGIPANKLETIFERFQQVDASDARQKQGTGLGLAICRQIIELHQGKIWVESTPDKGSTFYFT
ncbi:PAS domain-containing protein, partial [Pleurocapsales cyanobacterium LEGE 10410]|nr:PAS domain-containing protein [Pleurocapsales cyanobacterium LEGE 10410]